MRKLLLMVKVVIISTMDIAQTDYAIQNDEVGKWKLLLSQKNYL